MRFAVVLALALAGCGEAEVRAPETGGEPVVSAMQAEAEKACAVMTTYTPGAPGEKPAETQALMKREYDLCVASVAKDRAPALRGRTMAP